MIDFNKFNIISRKSSRDRKCRPNLSGINFFNNLTNNEKNKPDVIILARGGGSLEDLLHLMKKN